MKRKSHVLLIGLGVLTLILRGGLPLSELNADPSQVGTVVVLRVKGPRPDQLSERLSLSNSRNGLPGATVISYWLSFFPLDLDEPACSFSVVIQEPFGPTEKHPDGVDPRGPVNMERMRELLAEMPAFHPVEEDAWVPMEYVGVHAPKEGLSATIWTYPVPPDNPAVNDWQGIRDEGKRGWALKEWGDTPMMGERLASLLPWLGEVPTVIPVALGNDDLLRLNESTECSSRLEGILAHQAVLWRVLRGDYLREVPEDSAAAPLPLQQADS